MVCMNLLLIRDSINSNIGRIEPIPFFVKRDMTGLGKMNQDVKMIETTVSQRRNLDSERQRMETEAQRRLREVGHLIPCSQ